MLNSSAAQALPGTEAELATQLPCKEDRCSTDTKVTILLPQPRQGETVQGDSNRQGQGQGQGQGQRQQHIRCEGRGQCQPGCHQADWMPTSPGSLGTQVCLLASESSPVLTAAQPAQHDIKTLQGIDAVALSAQGLTPSAVRVWIHWYALNPMLSLVIWCNSMRASMVSTCRSHMMRRNLVLRSELNLFICIASGLNFGSACGLKPTAVGNVRCCCSMLMT